MAHVVEHVDEIGVESPYLVEGLPGVGLVGKIAADHLIRQGEMEPVASVHCDGIPNVAVYAEDEYDVNPPVRIFADAERDLLALQSDVPVSPNAANGFASCLIEWFQATDVTPIFLVGLAAEKDGVPEMYGVATGTLGSVLAEQDIGAPTDSGMVSGPTGALLAEADQAALDGLGLVVQANPQFPDPEAARVLLTDGVGPIAGIDVETDTLVEQAEEIAEAREKLAQRMQEANQESSRAQPVGMYQ